MPILPAVTVSLVPQARGGPFVLWDDLPTACARAAAMGFAAIEVFPSHPDEIDGHALRELLKEHGLRLAAMGTGAGWVVRKLSLTDPDPHLRMHAWDFIGAVIDFAGGFGAPAIIGSMQGRWGGAVSRDQALAWLKEGLDQLGPRAHALEVPLLFEPLNRYETNLLHTVDDSVAFLSTLQTTNVKLLCDLFHMNIEESDIAGALRRGGRHVGHVHFADSNRRAIGFGHTAVGPIVSALRDIQYSGFISAEILPLPDDETAGMQTMRAFREAFGTPFQQ